MLWVKEFNYLKNQANEKLQETTMSLLLENEDKFEKINTKIIDILNNTKYGNKKFVNSDEEIDYINENLNNTIINNFVTIHEIFEKQALDNIKILSANIASSMRKYKEREVIKQRCNIMVNDMFETAIEVFESVKEAYLEDVKFYLRELEDRKKELLDNGYSDVVNRICESIVEYNSDKYTSLKRKACTHRELVKIAEELGYLYHRTGVHPVYKNKVSKKTVPIPIHSKQLGLGISITIQKQLIDRAS